MSSQFMSVNDRRRVLLKELLKVTSFSHDPHTKIGCILVSNDFQQSILTSGYSSFPTGIQVNDSRLQRPEKYYWINHAEQSLLMSALNSQIPVKGSHLYITSPVICTDCAKNLCQAAIHAITFVEFQGITNPPSPDKWTEHYIRSNQMFHESGITLRNLVIHNPQAIIDKQIISFTQTTIQP